MQATFPGVESLRILFELKERKERGAHNDNFWICSEHDLRSRIFGTFILNFLACLPPLGFSNIQKMV